MTNADKDVEKLDLSYIASVNVKRHNHSGKCFLQYLGYDSTITS